MIFMWKSMVSCKCSLKPIQSMVIHDLDDEFWGMTWKPPFEWRNTYHTRAEQDHTIHWFYGQNPQFKYRPSVKLLDIGTCNTLARTLGHCPRESKQVSQMSNDFFGRKTDMDSLYIWIFMDLSGFYMDLSGFYMDLSGFYMDSLWILHGFSMDLYELTNGFSEISTTAACWSRESQEIWAVFRVSGQKYSLNPNPTSFRSWLCTYIYMCMFIYK